MPIPFLSFKKMHDQVKADMMQAFENVYDSHYYVLGKHLETFERNYAAYSTTKFCAGVANGLDALVISLKLLEVGSGDEVIVPSNTYIATYLAVSAVGATPVAVEPNIQTYNINPDLIEHAITSKTKAIIPVHLYGQICEMNKIMELAKKYNLYVVEDNAQGQGTYCQGKISGSFGDINAVSFYPGKNLGAIGDAGAITTDDTDLYQKACMIRNYGSKKKYFNEIKGLNSRLDELQAAFLDVKLKRMDAWNKERNDIAQLYNSNLKGLGDLILPFIAEGCTSNYHLYVIRTKKRDQLQDYLNNKGIGTLIHYPVPPHLQEAYKEMKYRKGAFPIAEEIADTCLSLPIYPGLNDKDIVEICESIARFYSK